jgi:predicted nucleic acid-binding protein
MNAEQQKDQFVDTNTLVYAYDRSSGHKRAIAV